MVGHNRSNGATWPKQRAPTPVTDSLARGRAAEDRARSLLEAAGLAFVAANVRYPFGELDLVMREGATLVFVEVRERATMGYGGAAASVNARKRLRLRRAAQRYLQQFHNHRSPPCRFDVVAFEAGDPHWIQGAF